MPKGSLGYKLRSSELRLLLLSSSNAFQFGHYRVCFYDFVGQPLYSKLLFLVLKYFQPGYLLPLVTVFFISPTQ